MRWRQELRELQGSSNSVLSFSFFITKKMKTELLGGRLTGTLPILYVFLARSGKTIREVSYVGSDRERHLQPAAAAPAKAEPANGVEDRLRRRATARRARSTTSAPISPTAASRRAASSVLRRLGTGDSLVKSASYLMHSAASPRYASSSCRTAPSCAGRFRHSAPLSRQGRVGPASVRELSRPHFAFPGQVSEGHAGPIRESAGDTDRFWHRLSAPAEGVRTFCWRSGARRRPRPKPALATQPP